MAQMLINVVFWILNFVANIVLAPIMALVNTVIPSFSTFIGAMTSVVSYGLTYVAFFIKLFMIPTPALLLVVTFGFAILAFNVGVRSAGLVLQVYNYFKP